MEKGLILLIQSLEKSKDLKTNSNNHLFNYCNHKKNNTLEIYLYYFGEFKHSYKRYDNVYEIFKHDLLDTYVKSEY